MTRAVVVARWWLTVAAILATESSAFVVLRSPGRPTLPTRKKLGTRTNTFRRTKKSSDDDDKENDGMIEYADFGGDWLGGGAEEVFSEYYNVLYVCM